MHARFTLTARTAYRLHGALAAALLLPATYQAHAQTGGVRIGTAGTPDASAALDINSTGKGLLPPRLSQAQRDAIVSPAAGLTVYNTSTNKLNTWNGTSWDAALSATEQAVENPAQTFAYTGGVQTYTVPAGVTSLLVDARGASGGGDIYIARNLGGAGARVQATLNVVPGQMLQVRVGGAGRFATNSTIAPGGYNGGGAFTLYGGGGGATDVRGSGGTLADRLLVAGGGGGGGYNQGGSQGGAGGAPNGGNGIIADGNGGAVSATGGTQTAGGSAGGALGTGGGGPSGGGPSGGGGGGGGYYGGGGGPGGGGGGSSWVTTTGSTGVVMTAGANVGNGSLTITPNTAYAAPTLSGSNFVNVPGTWQVSGADVYRAAGRVGIGTSSPATPLDVRAADAAITVGLPNNTGGALYLGNSGHGLQRNYNGGGNDVGLYTTSANLYLSANGIVGNQFVLLNNGNVGIGTSPGAKLHVAGGVKIDGSNTLEFGAGVAGKEVNAGKIGYRAFSNDALDIIGAGTGSNRVVRVFAESGLGVAGPVNAQSFNNNSDARFKTNVRPIGAALSSVLALRGVRYDWNALGVQHGGRAGAPQVGLIAQELEKLYPELVSTDKDGYKAVNYAQLTPVLLEALKEQQAQIEALKAEAATAKAELQTVKTQTATDKAQATATLETFEARLRRLEAAGGGHARR